MAITTITVVNAVVNAAAVAVVNAVVVASTFVNAITAIAVVNAVATSRDPLVWATQVCVLQLVVITVAVAVVVVVVVAVVVVVVVVLLLLLLFSITFQSLPLLDILIHSKTAVIGQLSLLKTHPGCN